MFFKKKEKQEKPVIPVSLAFMQYPDIFDAKRIQPNRKDFYVDCPFCGRPHKLNVSNKGNVWRCAACGKSGNAISLVSELEHISGSDAYKKLLAIYNGEPVEVKQKLAAAAEKDPDERNMAPLGVRNTAYEIMLNETVLGRKHKKALMKRGLSEEQINAFQFKSVPIVGSYAIAQKAIVESGIHSTSISRQYNWGIPGFYGIGDNAHIIRMDSGILIPVRWWNGEISCFQVRYDDLPEDATDKQRENFQRYKYFSSAGRKYGIGCSDIENIHFVGFDYGSDTTPETVNLTEGALKADVASALSGDKPFIAVLGVNMQARIPEVMEYLKEHGTKKINIMFDMDYQDKPEVAKALKSLCEKIDASGLEWKQITWSKQYKGIDDFLLARKLLREKVMVDEEG